MNLYSPIIIIVRFDKWIIIIKNLNHGVREIFQKAILAIKGGGGGGGGGGGYLQNCKFPNRHKAIFGCFKAILLVSVLEYGMLPTFTPSPLGVWMFGFVLVVKSIH